MDTHGTLTQVILRLKPAIQAEHANGLIDDTMREHLDALFPQWVDQIEDLFDPPHMKELTAACPECGQRWHVEDGVQKAAVIIPVKKGRALIAECRACEAMWATETDLIGLAEAMGVDVDFIALRELVNTPE